MDAACAACAGCTADSVVCHAHVTRMASDFEVRLQLRGHGMRTAAANTSHVPKCPTLKSRPSRVTKALPVPIVDAAQGIVAG